jgi:hypothetical protein
MMPTAKIMGKCLIRRHFLSIYMLNQSVFAISAGLLRLEILDVPTFMDLIFGVSNGKT